MIHDLLKDEEKDIEIGTGFWARRRRRNAVSSKLNKFKADVMA